VLSAPVKKIVGTPLDMNLARRAFTVVLRRSLANFLAELPGINRVIAPVLLVLRAAIRIQEEVCDLPLVPFFSYGFGRGPGEGSGKGFRFVEAGDWTSQPPFFRITR